jgi:hypothetical protein
LFEWDWLLIVSGIFASGQHKVSVYNEKEDKSNKQIMPSPHVVVPEVKDHKGAN